MLVKWILEQKGSNVITTKADVSVAQAARLLNTHRIGAVVVQDGDGKVVGILSERDIVRGMSLHGDKVQDMEVSQLMSCEVLTSTPQDSTEALMAVMTNRRIRHLPVIEDGKLVGMVSIGDVVKTQLDEAQLEVNSLREYVAGGR